MNSSPTAYDKLRQIEGWCARLSQDEQLTREQPEWLLREAATSAATVGAAEAWLAIALHDASRGGESYRPHCIGGIRTSDAEVTRRAMEVTRPTTINAMSFAELCTMLQFPQGAAPAAPEVAQAKQAAIVKASPTTVASPSRPSWWFAPKAPVPKPPPANWAPVESAVTPQEANIARAMQTDWGAAGVPPPPHGAAQMGYLSQPYKAPPDVPLRTVRFASTNSRDEVGSRGNRNARGQSQQESRDQQHREYWQ